MTINKGRAAAGEPRTPEEALPLHYINRSVNRPEWIRLSFSHWERLAMVMPAADFATYSRLFFAACQFEGRLPLNRAKLAGLTGLTEKQIDAIFRDHGHLLVIEGDELVITHAAEETRRALSRRDTNRQNASAGGKVTQARRLAIAQSSQLKKWGFRSGAIAGRICSCKFMIL